MTIEVVNMFKTHFRSNSKSKGKRKLRHSTSMPLDLKYNDYGLACPHDPAPAGKRMYEPSGLRSEVGGTPEAHRPHLAPPSSHEARREGSASSLRTVDLDEWSARPMDSIDSLREVFRAAHKLPNVPVMRLPDNFVVPEDFPREDEVIRANMTDEQCRLMDAVAAIRAGREAGIVQGGSMYTGRQPVHSRTVSAGQSYSRPTHIAYPDMNTAQGHASARSRVARDDVRGLQRSMSERVPARSQEQARRLARAVPQDGDMTRPRHESHGLQRSGSAKIPASHSPLRRMRAQLELRGHKAKALSDSVLTSTPTEQLPERRRTTSDRPPRKLRRPAMVPS
ncbi:hypothetical protein HDZ31DRAFT_60164 [Schizophyllum fasciatum]